MEDWVIFLIVVASYAMLGFMTTCLMWAHEEHKGKDRDPMDTLCLGLWPMIWLISLGLLLVWIFTRLANPFRGHHGPHLFDRFISFLAKLMGTWSRG